MRAGGARNEKGGRWIVVGAQTDGVLALMPHGEGDVGAGESVTGTTSPPSTSKHAITKGRKTPSPWPTPR